MDKYYIKQNNHLTNLILIEDGKGFITGIHNNYDTSKLEYKETPLLLNLKDQLTKYFEGTLKEFDIPYRQKTTPFQKEVYDVLVQVPYGYTVTYGDIAYMIGKPKGSRAVGNALGRNNLLIVVPCHRVLSTTGLGGFSSGLNVKKELLKLEGSLKWKKLI